MRGCARRATSASRSSVVRTPFIAWGVVLHAPSEVGPGHAGVAGEHAEHRVLGPGESLLAEGCVHGVPEGVHAWRSR